MFSLYEAVRQQSARHADSDAPGFLELWRSMNGRYALFENLEAEEWAIEEIEKCLPGCIGLAADILKYWFPQDVSNRKGEVRRARTRSRRSLKRLIDSNLCPSLCDCLGDHILAVWELLTLVARPEALSRGLITSVGHGSALLS